jgi:ADP-L-glycero-D-manno-heptose 6-epimerase
MIVVTGAAGFIGSCLVAQLNLERFTDVVLVDDFSDPIKMKNLEGKIFSQKVHRYEFITWLSKNHELVQVVFHLGARTDTTEFDRSIFNRLNLNYSKNIWNACVEFGLPLVYASSAATYGDGEFGFNDDHSSVSRLKPLNPYGDSKQQFDVWALSQKRQPFFWAGLKFFNVYGPNEYHKGRMASVIFHAYKQIKETDKMSLFRSHNPNYKDGEQLRDFIYVKDLARVCMFLMRSRPQNGIFNLGSGKARTFKDLVSATFRAADKPEAIDFVDTPQDIRDKYQYFTEAEMGKLKSIGYDTPFTPLEKGVEEYITQYLSNHSYF